MRKLEIELVQESWAQVVPIADEAMAMFYSNLFDLDQKCAQLFAGKDMAAQGAKLSEALDLVIRHLDQPDLLATQLQEMGARHAGYGAFEGDFATVGDALLVTLETGLGDNWTRAHEQSWLATYTFVAEQMVTGLQAQQAA